MDQDKLNKYNEIELARTAKSLENTRAKAESHLADLTPEMMALMWKLMNSQDENIQFKVLTMWIDRVVPKVAVRSTDTDNDVVESEARKATRAEIEELLKKRKAS